MNRCERKSLVGYTQVGKEPIEIGADVRLQHSFIVGQTGVGKSTLMENLVIDDIEKGRGVGLIDPHGSSVERILDSIPRSRINDVLYLDATDGDYPVGFNPLAGEYEPQLLASNLVTSMKSIWSESWSDSRLQNLLFHAIAALAECENTTLLGVRRILLEPGYRQWVMRQVKDPLIRQFWEEEFPAWDRRYRADAIAAIQNRLGQLVSRKVVRNSIGQVRDRVKIRQAMDEGRIVLVNLRKGQIGEQGANFLGSLLVTQFLMGAMSRAVGSRAFFLHIDEFASLTTTSLASILSECRKYGLSLSLSSQFTRQIPEVVRDAIYGNVGSTFCFRLGFQDAEIMARHFGNDFPPERLVELGNFELIAQIRLGTGRSFPVAGKTIPPIQKRCGHAETVRERSRRRFSTKRLVVEEKIERWLESQSS